MSLGGLDGYLGVITNHSVLSVARQCLHCCMSDQPNLYGETEISGGLNSKTKTPEPTDEKFGVGDYVGDISPHAKIQNDRPIGSVAAYMREI